MNKLEPEAEKYLGPAGTAAEYSLAISAKRFVDLLEKFWELIEAEKAAQKKGWPR